jgi:hypothetical protein
VAAAISEYNTGLMTFSGEFLYSNFVSIIDSADPSIISNTTDITLTRVINPIYIYYGTSASYYFTLGNPITSDGNPEDAILSTGFMIAGDTVNTYYIDDDGVGNLRLFYYTSTGVKIVTNPTIGTVNYQTGYVYISSLNISSLVSNTFSFNIRPASYDVVGYQTQIISINPTTTSISIQPIISNTTYPFANIRS